MESIKQFGGNMNKLEMLYEAVIELLNHLEDVLDNENFEKIDENVWNKVSMFKYIHGLKEHEDES